MDPQNLTVAFAVWAAVVGMIGMAIVWELARLRGEVHSMTNLLNEHMMETQGRLTAVETHLQVKDGFQPQNHFGMRGK